MASMHDQRSRGFTLLELIIAGGLAGIIAVAAFAAVTNMQQATGTQMEATSVFSSGRFGLDMMLRDIRMAGDSNELFANYCIRDPAMRHPNTLYACPAILEAHPWRIVLAMNNWAPAAAGVGIDINSPFAVGATPPTRASMLWDRPDNMVAYEFVPLIDADFPIETLQVRNPAGTNDFQRDVIRGRIDRIVNPFGLDTAGGFNVLPPQRSVLVENVVLDNAMRCNPLNPENSNDPDACDPRFDHALFGYRLLARQNTLVETAGRTTSSTMFLSPPLNFYAPGRPAFQFGVDAPTDGLTFAGLPTAAEVRGLKAGAVPAGDGIRLYDDTVAELDGFTRESMADALVAADPFNPTIPNSVIRLIYDRQRIRAVRVSFKVYSGREDPNYRLGLNLDDQDAAAPQVTTGLGTSPLFQFESEAELKVFSSRASLVDL